MLNNNLLYENIIYTQIDKCVNIKIKITPLGIISHIPPQPLQVQRYLDNYKIKINTSCLSIYFIGNNNNNRQVIINNIYNIYCKNIIQLPTQDKLSFQTVIQSHNIVFLRFFRHTKHQFLKKLIPNINIHKVKKNIIKPIPNVQIPSQLKLNFISKINDLLTISKRKVSSIQCPL